MRKSVRDLETRFAGLLCTAHHALGNVGIPDSHVRSFLNQISVSLKENIPLYKISHFSIEEIILFCSQIGAWDFLNVRLLQDIANYFGVEKLQALLREYCIALNNFKQNTKLSDFLRVWAGRNTPSTFPDSEPVFIKSTKWKDYTLADVECHEEYLTGEFELKALVLRFSNAKLYDGSVVLMWLVTKSVASEMKRIMCSNEKPTFDSMTFQELIIGGRTFKVHNYYTVVSMLPVRNYHLYDFCRSQQTMTASTSTALANLKSSGLTEQKNTFTGSSHLTQ